MLSVSQLCKMTKHRQDSEHESKTNLGFYFSRTGSVEGTEPPKLKMFCPRCKSWVFQVKGFRFDNKHEMPCVRCNRCHLIHDSGHYKKLIIDLRATGWKPPL